MKKLLLVLVVFAFLSCNIGGEDALDFESELISITSVDLPLQFTFGEEHEITVNYIRPNGCYEFNNFIVQPNGNTRTVAVVDNVYNDPNCTQTPENATVSFQFLVLSLDTYIFQFFQGEDENGEDLYLVVEVPVVE